MRAEILGDGIIIGSEQSKSLTHPLMVRQADTKTSLSNSDSTRPMKFAAGISNLFGSVISSDLNSSGKRIHADGMYTLSPQAPENTVKRNGGIAANGGGAPVGDSYYLVRYYSLSEIQIERYDTINWYKNKTTAVGVGLIASDVTYDPATDKVYGCFYNDDASGYVFGTIDYTTATRTSIAALSDQWNSVAADKNGNIYAIDMSGNLLSVNKTNGETALIGATGVTPKYISSAAFDYRYGKLFWTVAPADESTYLYEINTTTGAATLIYKFENGDQVTGLFVPKPTSEEGAPDIVENAVVNFPNGTLSGTVDFTAPTNTYDGNPGTGNITYNIDVDGTIMATGEVAYGAAVSCPLTFTEPASHEFTITTSNSVGTSPSKSITQFIGYGKPAVATSASMTYADGKFTLTWVAPTRTTDGGYFDADNLKYKVVRMPDEVVVAEATSELTLVDQVTTPETLTLYYYQIWSINGGIMSTDSRSSNKIGIGCAPLPYLEEFSYSDAIYNYTIIDSNADNKKWAINSNQLRIMYNSSLDMDDWAVTPAFNLKSGHLYRFSLDSHKYADKYDEVFEVKIGKAATAEAMTQTVIEETHPATTVTNYTNTFTVPEDGVYYIGVHGISAKKQYYLYVDNIALSIGVATEAPDSVTNYKVVGDPNGLHKATISFTAPTKNVSGNAISEIGRIEITRDGELIKTFDNPEPGADYSFVDEQVEKAGYKLYTVTPYSSKGTGQPAEIEEFVGFNIPNQPTNIKATEDSATGIITITWDAPTTDILGRPLSQNDITYKLVEQRNTVQSTLTETLQTNSYSYSAFEPGVNPIFFIYGIYASTEYGTADVVSSRSVAAGRAYDIPFTESFVDGSPQHLYSTTAITGSGKWQIYTDASLSAYSSQDDDNGYAGMKRNAAGDVAQITTAKLNLKDADAPMLTFYLHRVNSYSTNKNQLDVQIGVDGEFTTVGSYILKELAESEWNYITIPLNSYKGKEVQVNFLASCPNAVYVFIDNIRVCDRYVTDMEAASISTPDSVAPNTPFSVDVVVRNNGLTSMDNNFSVALYRNDEKIKEIELEGMAIESKTNISFQDQLSVVAPSENVYRFEITAVGDENLKNNVSSNATVKLSLPDYPVPTDVAGANHDGKPYVSWNEPTGYAAQNLNLTGYNIYRDSTKVNSEVITTTSFTDSELPYGTYSYQISAVYDAGESAPTDKISITTSGVNGLTTDGISITIDKGKVVIFNANGKYAEVFTASGIILFRGYITSDNFSINATTGTVIAKIADDVYKLQVK